MLNHDGGGVMLEDGRAVQVDLTASEKVYADFDFTVTNPGGHSSVPPREGAIYSLARALDRVSSHDFAFELNNVTRAYFERMAKREEAARRFDPARRPADATGSAGAAAGLRRSDLQRAGSHHVRRDALVRRAREQCPAADCACKRELPHPARAFAGRGATGTGAGGRRSDGQSAVLQLPDGAARGRCAERARLCATAAATRCREAAGEDRSENVAGCAGRAGDGGRRIGRIYTNAAGLPTYMVSGSALAADDIRAHGQDERLGVQEFYNAVDFFYDYLKAVVFVSVKMSGFSRLFTCLSP